MCWNVHGFAQLKFLNESFLEKICEHDVVFLQEAHLYPGEEETIKVPGYDVYAVSRPMTQDLRRRGGGVLALVR